MNGPTLSREVDGLLRRCVQCGLCLPHCATWLATGSEVQSPRGRLVLLGEALRDGAPDRSFLEAFDQCIGCRACATACPSGVPFALLERGQALAAAGLPAPSAAVPGPLLRRLDRVPLLRVLRGVAAVGRAVAGALAGRRWRRRLDGWPLVRLLGTVPSAPAADAALVAQLDRLSGCGGSWRRPAPAPVRGELAFFRGCANRGLLPDTSRRLLDLCAAAGFATVAPAGQDCCGALAAHGGRPGRTAWLHRRNRAAFAALPAAVPVLAEAAGCALELAGLDAAWAARVVDPTQLLATAPLPPLARLPLRVAVHDPCHARHGRGVVAPPRELLRRIPGLTVVEPDEAEVCCGSGGAWGLRHPDLAAELGLRKARVLAATGADLVVTTNPGCLGQIADGLALGAPDLPILPLTDLLWYAAARAAATPAVDPPQASS